ncbi:MAG: hypothetical protein JEZ09_05970 [Salinivirgaceae bacterium]|nr:hypothetical protein [Salinivirgaceae bacterium]
MLNYPYGMNIGTTIKEDYIKGDSTNLQIAPFIEGFRASMDVNESRYFQIYYSGTAFGNSLKNQLISGLNNNSKLKINTELVRQGLIEGLHDPNNLKTNQDPQENGK